MPSDRVSVISGIHPVRLGRGRRWGPATRIEKVYAAFGLFLIAGMIFLMWFGSGYHYEITVTNGDSSQVYYTDYYRHQEPSGHITFRQDNRVIILSGDEISIIRKHKNEQ